MKRQFRMPLLLALLAGALLPLSAAACDCGYAGAPCKAFEKTPTVFIGRVIGISAIDLKTASGDDYKDRLVAFEVERSYRGLTTETAEVLSDWNSDCGYRFQEGVRYIVYAYPRSPTAKLTTSICTRTRPLSEASADLEYLDKKDDPSYGFSPIAPAAATFRRGGGRSFSSLSPLCCVFGKRLFQRRTPGPTSDTLWPWYSQWEQSPHQFWFPADSSPSRIDGRCAMFFTPARFWSRRQPLRWELG